MQRRRVAAGDQGGGEFAGPARSVDLAADAADPGGEVVRGPLGRLGGVEQGGDGACHGASLLIVAGSLSAPGVARPNRRSRTPARRRQKGRPGAYPRNRPRPSERAAAITRSSRPCPPPPRVARRGGDRSSFPFALPRTGRRPRGRVQPAQGWAYYRRPWAFQRRGACGQHAARHHQRYGARAVVRRRHLGHGEAVVLADAEAQARGHRAQAVEGEAARPHPGREGERAEQRRRRAQQEARPAAEPREDHSRRDGRGHGGGHLDGDGQGGERLVLGERMADQRRHHRLPDGAGLRQRRAEEQEPDLPPHAARRKGVRNGSILLVGPARASRPRRAPPPPAAPRRKRRWA